MPSAAASASTTAGMRSAEATSFAIISRSSIPASHLGEQDGPLGHDAHPLVEPVLDGEPLVGAVLVDVDGHALEADLAVGVRAPLDEDHPRVAEPEDGAARDGHGPPLVHV